MSKKSFDKRSAEETKQEEKILNENEKEETIGSDTNAEVITDDIGNASEDRKSTRLNSSHT